MFNRIVVIGIEGSGKTYFINNVFNMKYKKIYEPNLKINEILKTDSNLLSIKDKQQLIHDAFKKRDTNSKEKCIMERDFISAVFIFKPEDNLYYKIIIEEYIKSYKSHLPDLVIFLTTPSEKCLERIKERNRSYELSLKLNELKYKTEQHYELIELYKKLNIDIFYYNNEDNYLDLIKYIKLNKMQKIEKLIKFFIKPKVIIFEGNIGSGITALLTHYKKKGFTVIEEPFKEIEEDYNNLIYEYYNNIFNKTVNSNINLLKFHSIIIQYKLFLYSNIYNKDKVHKNNIIFIERSALSWIEVFGKNNIINEKENIIMKNLYDNINKNILTHYVNKIIYLNVKPEICLTRANKNENKIKYNLDYLRTINHNYEDYIKSFNNVCIINNDDSINNTIGFINRYLKLTL